MADLLGVIPPLGVDDRGIYHARFSCGVFARR